MAAFILSNLTGLARQILVSRAFGTSGAMDAFTAASTFPDTLFNLVAGGALASAFLPTLSAFLADEDRAGAWRLISSVINLALLILTGLSLLSAWLAPEIVRYLLAPHFSPSQQALTAELLRIRLIAPAIFGLSGLLMGTLNAHQVFIWPALAPTMYWLGMIFGVVCLAPGMGIYGLAWGAVLGAVLHLAVQLPAVLRLPYRQYWPALGMQSPAVRQVVRLMGPRLIGVAVVQLNFIVNTILASGQPTGSPTAIQTAWSVVTMPQVVIAQSIAIAALPTFSIQAARGALKDMRASLAATLRGVILLSLPASFGLILLRRPVVALLFQYGKFDAHSTELVAWALLWYTVGLVGHSVVEIVSRAFYALQDTRTPVVIGATAMSLNLVFSVAFSSLFRQLGWMPHGGLAFANSLATALEMVGLLVLMRRQLNGLDGKELFEGLAQAAAATMLMSLALWGWLNWSVDRSAWFVTTGGIMIGGIAFALAVLGMKVKEAYHLLAVLQRIWVKFKFRLNG